MSQPETKFYESNVRKTHSKVSKIKYYVKFIGYGAVVVTKSEVEHATLDFVSGATFLHVNGGFAMVSTLADLPRFVADLQSNQLSEVDLAVHEDPAGHPNSEVKRTMGDNEICFYPGADPTKVIQRLTSRIRRVEPVLRQAEIIGSSIDRRPYSDFIAEIEATGLVRVVFHGYGIFEKSKLVFHPVGREMLIEGTRAFEMCKESRNVSLPHLHQQSEYRRKIVSSPGDD
jgi:hypothetical protein